MRPSSHLQATRRASLKPCQDGNLTRPGSGRPSLLRSQGALFPEHRHQHHVLERIPFPHALAQRALPPDTDFGRAGIG